MEPAPLVGRPLPPRPLLLAPAGSRSSSPVAIRRARGRNGAAALPGLQHRLPDRRPVAGREGPRLLHARLPAPRAGHHQCLQRHFGGRLPALQPRAGERAAPARRLPVGAARASDLRRGGRCGPRDGGAHDRGRRVRPGVGSGDRPAGSARALRDVSISWPRAPRGVPWYRASRPARAPLAAAARGGGTRVAHRGEVRDRRCLLGARGRRAPTCPRHAGGGVQGSWHPPAPDHSRAGAGRGGGARCRARHGARALLDGRTGAGQPGVRPRRGGGRGGTPTVLQGTAAVGRLTFTLDGTTIITTFTSASTPPYQFTWHTAHWVDGMHTLGVYARMTDGSQSDNNPTTEIVTLANGVTTAPTNTSSPVITTGTTPAAGQPEIVGAVGSGAAGAAGSNSVATEVRGWSPNLFLFLADVYETGTYEELQNGHDPSWRSMRGV